MINWRITAFISFCANKFSLKQFLFTQKRSDNIYFAYIDPKLIDKTSHFGDASHLWLGESALYGSISGLWGNYNYNFKKNIMYKLCLELIVDIKGKTYEYIAKRYSDEEADEMWNKLLKLKKSLSSLGYMSQCQLDGLDRSFSVGVYRLPRNETYIGLNKKGKFIRLYSGRHRLALAQLMDIKEIPVIITMHHPDAIGFLPKKSRLITGCENDYKPFE